MGFMDAVKAVLTNYVGFSGRARRSEFWWFFLFQVIVNILSTIVGNAIGFALLPNLVGLALLLPGLAVGVRRLHDTGRSGWWWLIGLIPLVGIIVLIVFWVGDTQAGANKYGASPKESAGGAAPAAPAV
jgi:uncharacterized membrane protein YhaH (DUF805 family)